MDDLRFKCEELWNMREGIDDHEILELIDELYEKMWNKSCRIQQQSFNWKIKEKEKEANFFKLLSDKLTCKPEIEQNDE